MSSQEYIKSITDIIPEQTPSSQGSFFANITWQTWVIIFLIFALLGINIFAYLAKGTQETVNLAEQIFGPILTFFGYNTLTTTKQTIETTATGTKAGVDIIANTSTNAIDTLIKTPSNTTITTQPNTTSYSGKMATSSLPVQTKMQETGADVEQWQQDALDKALANAKQYEDVRPDDSRSSIQTIGKAGWCFIGSERGIRTCSEIGANDVCMSGDVFPTQAVCMNPNLRA
jgi:hypothetical protein